MVFVYDSDANLSKLKLGGGMAGHPSEQMSIEPAGPAYPKHVSGGVSLSTPQGLAEYEAQQKKKAAARKKRPVGESSKKQSAGEVSKKRPAEQSATTQQRKRPKKDDGGCCGVM